MDDSGVRKAKHKGSFIIQEELTSCYGKMTGAVVYRSHRSSLLLTKTLINSAKTSIYFLRCSGLPGMFFDNPANLVNKLCFVIKHEPLWLP